MREGAVVITISGEEQSRLTKLQERLGVDSLQMVLNAALSFLDRCATAREEGLEVSFVNMSTQQITVCEIEGVPLFEGDAQRRAA